MTPAVYMITNNVNQKIYIGKTCDIIGRWTDHKSMVSNGSKFHVHRAMRKYGVENFTMDVISYYDTENEALQAETFWISEMRKYLGRDNVYNKTDGGEGSTGMRHTTETKARIRRTLKQRYGKFILTFDERPLID